MRNISIKSAAVAAAAMLALTGCGAGEAADPQPAASSAPAGNGVAALSADEILERAKTALTGAKSYQFKGSVDDGSKVDFKISGADRNGKMTMGDAEVELLAVGADKYMRGNAAFFTTAMGPEQGALVGQALGGRWIAGAGSDPSFAALFTIGDVDDVLKPTGTLTKGEEKAIDGVPAIALKDSGDAGSTLYVATTGEPYPLQMAGANGATLVFSGFGEPVSGLTKPAADQVIDLDKIAKTGK